MLFKKWQVVCVSVPNEFRTVDITARAPTRYAYLLYHGHGSGYRGDDIAHDRDGGSTGVGVQGGSRRLLMDWKVFFRVSLPY